MAVATIAVTAVGMLWQMMVKCKSHLQGVAGVSYSSDSSWYAVADAS